MSRQGIQSGAQALADGDQVQHQAHEFRSPWLTTAEACAYLRYTGKCRLRSLYAFLKERGVPTARRGRVLLIARLDLEKAIGARRHE